ncbi:MAG: hypothetical protein HYU04_00480 [Candidatus Wildermuthbacteria bacterium]|nr:hypothetical protein [Candidatus Wildermuthbacteria bacterium]
MFQLDKKNIVIIGVVGAVILGGIYFYSSGELSQLAEEPKEEQVFEEVTSIAGRVTSVNAGENSFVVLQPAEERSFTVKLGESTASIRLVFPFDVANPPSEGTFTPEREIITIEDLAENDQVFVRASSPIKTNQDIVNPLEVQVLP